MNEPSMFGAGRIRGIDRQEGNGVWNVHGQTGDPEKI